MARIRVLIVEHDITGAAAISLHLSQLGYEVTGIESRGEEAILHAKIDCPDIMLMGIELKGALDGIQTVKAIREFQHIPTIYLTANSDEVIFNKAKETHPFAIISKPFNNLDLEHALALAVENMKEIQSNTPARLADAEVLDDRVFVRHCGKLVKILMEQIIYIEAERNYCVIVTESGNYTVVSSLKTIESKLPASDFIRVHRSYMINISKLDLLGEDYVEISRKVIPVSKSYKEILMSRIQTI